MHFTQKALWILTSKTLTETTDNTMKFDAILPGCKMYVAGRLQKKRYCIHRTAMD